MRGDPQFPRHGIFLPGLTLSSPSPVPLSPQAGGGVAGKAAFAAGAGAIGYSAVAAPKTEPQAKAK